MDRSSIDSALRKKGFSIDDSRDHRFYHHKLDGKITGIKTKISRGVKLQKNRCKLAIKDKKPVEIRYVSRI